MRIVAFRKGDGNKTLHVLYLMKPLLAVHAHIIFLRREDLLVTFWFHSLYSHLPAAHLSLGLLKVFCVCFLGEEKKTLTWFSDYLGYSVSWHEEGST